MYADDGGDEAITGRAATSNAILLVEAQIKLKEMEVCLCMHSSIIFCKALLSCGPKRICFNLPLR
jgi:hypothetical protein